MEINQEKYSMLLALIGQRTKAEAVKPGKIEQALGVTGAQVRDLIRHARMQGVRIASSGAGYFFANNAAEIQDTIKHLEASWDLQGRVIAVQRGEGVAG